jgi:hypothetical protein
MLVPENMNGGRIILVNGIELSSSDISELRPNIRILRGRQRCPDPQRRVLHGVISFRDDRSHGVRYEKNSSHRRSLAGRSTRQHRGGFKSRASPMKINTNRGLRC